MFRINQLQQENGFLLQQHMACENTLQLQMKDHKRVTEENKDLRRQLKEREMNQKSMVEAIDCWLDKMEAKQNQQEEKLETLEADLFMKEEMIARMTEDMRTQKQEMETLVKQNQSMIMIMQTEAEEQVQRGEDKREKREERREAESSSTVEEN